MLGKNSPPKKKPRLSPMSSGNPHSMIYALKGRDKKECPLAYKNKDRKNEPALSPGTLVQD
jgi:hypothetical protein